MKEKKETNISVNTLCLIWCEMLLYILFNSHSNSCLLLPFFLNEISSPVASLIIFSRTPVHVHLPVKLSLDFPCLCSHILVAQNPSNIPLIHQPWYVKTLTYQGKYCGNKCKGLLIPYILSATKIYSLIYRWKTLFFLHNTSQIYFLLQKPELFIHSCIENPTGL